MKSLGVFVLLALITGLLGGYSDLFQLTDQQFVGWVDELGYALSQLVRLEELEFDYFIDDLFIYYVTADSITLNFYISDPDYYGIDVGRFTPTLGEVASIEAIEQYYQEDFEYDDEIIGFHYGALRPDQQIIYDILTRSMDINSQWDGEDFHFYSGYINPGTGIQAQLPFVLAEFNFRSLADIEIYFKLLEDTERYFGEIIDFERERSRRGMFLSVENVDKVLDGIESFLSFREDNLMILIFNDMIDGFAGIDERQREQYKQRNENLVFEYFLPAYENLYAAMGELRGVGAREGGLANLPEGRMYAEAFLQYITDSDMTIEQVDSLLTSELEAIEKRLVSLLESDLELAQSFDDGTIGVLHDDTPENYMDMLEMSIAQDFPPLGPVSYSIREVHPSLQDHLGPAFYLSPAIDVFNNNVIYINPAEATDSLYLFTTLAHEGYPGHMYQTVFFLQGFPHPVRNFLTGIGYSEGWATYVEVESFRYAGFSENETELLQLLHIYDLLFTSRIDLAVNALGWDIDSISDWMDEMGFQDHDFSEDIFHAVTGDPLRYLPYSVGYLEMSALRQKAARFMGRYFDLAQFHGFILDFGPAPFAVIDSYLADWADFELKGIFSETPSLRRTTRDCCCYYFTLSLSSPETRPYYAPPFGQFRLFHRNPLSKSLGTALFLTLCCHFG